jgi:hypothetical protein
VAPSRRYLPRRRTGRTSRHHAAGQKGRAADAYKPRPRRPDRRPQEDPHAVPTECRIPLACALSRFAWDVSCAGDRSSAQLACALSPDAPEHVRVLSHHLTPRRQHLFVPATRDCTVAQRVVGQRAARLVRATTEAGTPGPDRNPGASAALPHGRATGCRRAARKGLSLAVAAHWPGHQQAGSAGCSPTRPPDPPAAAPLG